MSLAPLHVIELLKRYNLRPQKSLGQNFLADHNALLKIVRDAGVSQEDRVLEIGAGLGGLTRLLADAAHEVVAIEIDRHLFPALEAVTAPFGNVRLVQGDILAIPPETLFKEDGYLVVANIPYYITSAVIRHLLEASVRPRKVVLTIQREVAERILNQDEKMSLLSLSVQIYGQAHIASQIPSACFYPEPRVDSSVLVIDVDPEPKLSPQAVDALFRLAHAAFSQKRKMLRNGLQSALGGNADAVSDLLAESKIDPRRRPETLSLDEWIRLTQAYSQPT